MRSTSSTLPPEIRFHHLRPSHHFGRTAGRYDTPVAQHDDAIGELHYGAHHVLDEHDARALRAACVVSITWLCTDDATGVTMAALGAAAGSGARFCVQRKICPSTPCGM